MFSLLEVDSSESLRPLSPAPLPRDWRKPVLSILSWTGSSTGSSSWCPGNPRRTVGRNLLGLDWCGMEMFSGSALLGLT